MAKKKKRNRLIITVLILVPLLFAAGYAFSSGVALERVRQWFSAGEANDPPEENGEPETPGEPGDETPGDEEPTGGPSEPQPGVEPTVPDADEPDEVPIIYVGQVLAIPGTGGGSSGTSPSRVITKGTVSPGAKQIALTFDSGWEFAHTFILLDILDRYGIKATFFPRADWLEDHPALGREIIARGHTMGNHSRTHKDMTAAKLSAAAIRDEMRQSTEIIQRICGVRPYLFRPPYGAYDDQLLRILAEEGYPYTIMWSIDTIDWDAGNRRMVGGKETLVDEDFIVNRVLENTDSNKNNGIVLMHIGGDTAGHLTVLALPRIIEGLRSQGYSFTTVDKMIPPPSAGGQAAYTVQKGDTLYSISRRYGVSVQQIIDANDL